MIDTPKEFKKRVRADLEAKYDWGMSQLTDGLPDYTVVYGITSMWIAGNSERNAHVDTTTPYYLRLRLAPSDDMCEHGMWFLGKVERKYGEFEQGNVACNDILTMYKSIKHQVYMYFVQNPKGICQVVEETKQEMQSVVIGRKVVCY